MKPIFVKFVSETEIEIAPKDKDGVVGFCYNKKLCEKAGYDKMLVEEPKNDDDAYYVSEGEFVIKKWRPKSLEVVKSEKIAEIDEYDNTRAVNEFAVNGVPTWLSKEQRAGIRSGIEALKTLKKNEYKLWVGANAVELPVATVTVMLAQLEHYAMECFNITAQHKVEVMKLTSNEDVKNYDYKQGYPAKLNFEI